MLSRVERDWWGLGIWVLGLGAERGLGFGFGFGEEESGDIGGIFGSSVSETLRYLHGF